LNRRLVEVAVERFGGLDVAFNNAGSTGESAPVADLSLDGWNEMLAVNLTSAFLGAKYQVPAMIARGGGSIVFTSTFVGHTAGMPGMGAYAASKAGLTGLVQVLAANIRVNALLPGGTDTALNPANFENPNMQLVAFIHGLHALKRLARPEEIAKAALFLGSDMASFVTGTSMLADGGVSINRT